MAGNNDFRVDGLNELERKLEEFGRLPQRVVTKAARKGANVVKKRVVGEIPTDTGDLKRGIKLVAEKTKKRGKKMFQATFDKGYNHVFQKPIENPGKYGGTRDHAYYPASQEFGFKSGYHGFIPGYHFMKHGALNAWTEAERIMIKEMTDAISKLLE